MKKLFLIVAIIAGFALTANAQPRAVGARLGYGITASYQHSLGEKNMLNVELEFPGFSGIAGLVTYDWVFPTNWVNKGNFKWFAGVGGTVGFYFNNAFSAGVVGRIGLEYNFEFPLQLSIDYRPAIGLLVGENYAKFNTGAMSYGGIALGVRYRF